MGQASCSELIKARPEQVWQVLADVTRMPDWAYQEGRFPYLVEAKYSREQQEGVGTIWVGVAADGQTATQRVTRWEPGCALAYELQAMEHAPLVMSQTNSFELQPAGEDTQLTWSVVWQLPGGFSIASLLMRFTAQSAFEQMMAGSLAKLRQLVEAETALKESSPPAEQASAVL